MHKAWVPLHKILLIPCHHQYNQCFRLSYDFSVYLGIFNYVFQFKCKLLGIRYDYSWLTTGSNISDVIIGDYMIDNINMKAIQDFWVCHNLCSYMKKKKYWLAYWILVKGQQTHCALLYVNAYYSDQLCCCFWKYEHTVQIFQKPYQCPISPFNIQQWNEFEFIIYKETYM